MKLAIAKYIPKAILAITGEIAVWLFGWFIALFYYRQEENQVTGYPSQFPGKLREHIDFPFTWATTFDDCADAHWYSGRMKNFSLFGWKPFANITQEQYEKSSWYRYCARVLWLYRNPAYTLARDLGFDQNGLQIEEIKNEEHLWDKGYPNTTFLIFKNENGQVGFLYERQIHLGFQFFFEFVAGYKAPWQNERKNRAMIANRWITIKRYPKVEPEPTNK